ncbi:hypothetical protein [Natronosalvus vescus]|uniref:DUF5789 family protein n=1 Tax=Natronosalvus vescus TaxID=2953881 RepID=UPI002090AE40|nr:hypothetical protein [Natronosalvus vescus]
MDEVKLSRVEQILEELPYPVSRAEAASAFDDVTLLLADGETNLGDAIADTHSDEYDSADALEDSLYNVLPREAIGEPYQSEGEG